MVCNKPPTKNIIFNFTDNFKFTTRLMIKDEKMEVLGSAKLLGSIISNDLKWYLNTSCIVKKANKRMELLLRRVASFNPPEEDLKEIDILLIRLRSILEKSATALHSSLTLLRLGVLINDNLNKFSNFVYPLNNLFCLYLLSS